MSFSINIEDDTVGSVGGFGASTFQRIQLSRVSKAAPSEADANVFIDVTGDGSASVEDIVAWLGNPIDTNGDGLTDDADLDWIASWLQLPGVTIPDCDDNGIFDVIEISDDPLLDLNRDGFLDLCQDPPFITLSGSIDFPTNQLGRHNTFINSDTLLSGGGAAINGPSGIDGGLVIYDISNGAAPVVSQTIDSNSLPTGLSASSFATTVAAHGDLIASTWTSNGGLDEIALFAVVDDGSIGFVDSTRRFEGQGPDRLGRLAALTSSGYVVTTSKDSSNRPILNVLPATVGGLGEASVAGTFASTGSISLGRGGGSEFWAHVSGRTAFGPFEFGDVLRINPDGTSERTGDLRQDNRLFSDSRPTAIDSDFALSTGQVNNLTAWSYIRDASLPSGWREVAGFSPPEDSFIPEPSPYMAYPYAVFIDNTELYIYHLDANGRPELIRRVAAPDSQAAFSRTGHLPVDVMWPNLIAGRSTARDDAGLILGEALFYDLSLDAVADCNTNRRPDSFEIEFGIAIDSNADAVPDGCQPCVIADFDAAGSGFDVFDLFAFLEAFEMQEASSDLAFPVDTFDATDIVAFIAAAAECEARQTTADDFEDIEEDGAVIESRDIGGVSVTMSSTSGAEFQACTYADDTPTAFNDLERGPNVPFAYDPSILGDRFVSTIEPLADTRAGRPYAELVFEFSEPVAAFGLTTMDVLQAGQPDEDFLVLTAFDETGEVIASQRRDGEQGPSGVQLQWLVEDHEARINRITLGGSLTLNARYGIDNVVLQRRP